MSEPRNVAVIGAGLMGHGIALVMARAGHAVSVTDPAAEARDELHGRIRSSMELMGVADEAEAAISRVTPVETVAQAVGSADAVFEAAPEKVELKQELFAEIEAHSPEGCMLASNTSAIPITKIMGGLSHRGRALGTHWWNPPHMIPLVEVIRTEWTEEGAIKDMEDLLADAGKTPVRVERDVPGFIGNRLQHAMWREAISLVENGICDAQAVDTVIKSSFGRRLSVVGPLEGADLIGTDLTLDVHNSVMADLDVRSGPSPYLERLVEEGKLGMKSGEGFHKWTPAEADKLRERVVSHLVRLEGILEE